MIDIKTEHLVHLQDVPELVPRVGSKRIHKSTPFRWASKGIRGPHSRVVLETIRAGGRLCTSTEALERFFIRLSTPGEELPNAGGSALVPEEGRSKHTAETLREIDDWRVGREESR